MADQDPLHDARKSPPDGAKSDWQPSLYDAINLAALRMYVLAIESLVLAIYRSDPDPARPRFVPLEKLLAYQIQQLRQFQPQTANQDSSGQCPGDDDPCGFDGLCYPPGTCPS